MDLRGLESIQWRGFSDREIQQLHNVKKVSKTKLASRSSPDPLGDETKTKPVKDNVLRTQQHEVATPEGRNNARGEMDDLKDNRHNSDVSKPQLSDTANDQESLARPLPQDTPTEADLTQQPTTMTLDEQIKQQKLMEEENKRKKALIEQTLNDRAQQQQLEKQMLMSVQTGLKELEEIVSKDVKILRDKIEETIRYYNSAKKRFDNAEKEYIAAKMELFKWSEQKELLSEHLCAVIQQNELRKAAKLSELLKSLQLEEAS